MPYEMGDGNRYDAYDYFQPGDYVIVKWDYTKQPPSRMAQVIERNNGRMVDMTTDCTGGFLEHIHCANVWRVDPDTRKILGWWPTSLPPEHYGLEGFKA